MPQPLFTVATITYNSAIWVRQAIESVLHSSFFDYEYLISDDSSSDNTLQIIKEYKDDRIIVLESKINIGEYANRNKVLQKATGKYIYFIDGDDVIFKNTLRNLSEYISSFPNTKMIWAVPHNDFMIFPVLVPSLLVTKMEFLGEYYWSMIGFPETVFETKTLISSGGFNENYGCGDYYLKKKIAIEHDVLMIPIGLAFWRTSPGQASKKLSENFTALIQIHESDMELLGAPGLKLNDAEKDLAYNIIMRRTMIQILNNSIFKGKILSFFKLKKRLKIPYSGFFKLMKKKHPVFKVPDSATCPLSNNYNFTNKTNRDVL